ncbi:hypothetical protein OVA13_04350 [Pseudoxanthomonas sp. SL93]|uniref:hypothetical protein n=1 Tax=Pseudoxanthomonas sp. SL93 TaxID=2995142 RepID=UPI00226F4008|nr:hypothetical protein [Pseudoxanthomonas sp. SL93]WAC64019.1 hypothetical protein OVA13_04350 [Pseudoxanthomonas sp. SL93]
MEFLRLCEQEDPQRQEWPFVCDRRGSGAIRNFVKQYLIYNYDRIVATQYGDKAATKSKAGTGQASMLVACAPFDVVELDEHSAGFIGTVRIRTPEGVRYLDAGRVTILLLADRLKERVHAFKVIYREQANSGDVLDVLDAATVGEPGRAHSKEEQQPVQPLVDLDSRFGWCGFNALLLDNALVHLAEEVVDRTISLCGCAVNFGPVHTPARRQLAERIFNALERAGFKRLPMTTGAHPNDPKRQDPEQTARRCELDAAEIVKLVADLVAKFNAAKGKRNLAASAHERMKAIICGEERDFYLFPFLPPLREGDADLSLCIQRVRVRGNLKTGRRPYFTFLEADYTSPELAEDWDAIGSELVIHIDRSNIRRIAAFKNGVSVGLCSAFGRWGLSDHSIDLRKHINKMIRAGYLENDHGGDVVAQFIKQLGEKVGSSKSLKGHVKKGVRQLADHNARRESSTSQTNDLNVTNAVNDLLDRASSQPDEELDSWADMSASNGDGYGP